ncbi:hypothetical protein [Salinibacter phage M8CRM-1]|uniref:Uncharacterized protein n=3 Tax=Kryptosalinivirus TaxID=2560163 RepID=A0A2I6UG85_9CAUD|nr:hypothetical protein FGG63_gp55 [Salinibacter phage M8CC-19]YP_009639523.1 hypothetical protein FGG67_gp57 [Salinibacter phage M8CRM-1]AUO79008.1 hypothetical protein [Salinibacter phage M8CC-19]AUO79169.1 hypothetical protein [Salinibacter phage M8CRM-1]AUO79241.1 hypothetical protein [Salinibacter phage M31CC-1]
MGVDLEVRETAVKETDPKLTSLEKYLELTEPFGLVNEVTVEPADEGVEITVHLNFVEMPYTFDKFADVCSFLHLIAMTAESQHEDE